MPNSAPMVVEPAQTFDRMNPHPLPWSTLRIVVAKPGGRS